MRIPTTIALSALFIQALAATLTVGNPSACRAETVWSGPTINFTQGATASDVLIPGTVAIERQPGSFLYNPFLDTFGPGDGTPSDTEWAFGTMDNHLALDYEAFSQMRAVAQSLGQHVSDYFLGKSMVMHIINEDIYISVTFTAWPRFGGSTFSYTRSTPAAVAPPPPTPTVSITSPTNTAVFAAPADVAISANAAVSTGTVTNVLFFRDSTLIGSKQTGPFTITASGLGAGSYGLKAVATAAGISATSSVVNISVVTPVVTSLAAPTATADNHFTFSYSSTPGLRYEVDVSSNLLTWTSLATNVATGNPSFFTNPISGDGNYYRVSRLPNP